MAAVAVVLLCLLCLGTAGARSHKKHGINGNEARTRTIDARIYISISLIFLSTLDIMTVIGLLLLLFCAVFHNFELGRPGVCPHVRHRQLEDPSCLWRERPTS